MFATHSVEMDVRPGGRIYLVMRGPDGIDLPMKGVFQEVEPPDRLVFLSGALEDDNGVPQLETLTTVTLDELSGKTRLHLSVVVTRRTPAAEGALAGMEQGWSESLDKLAESLQDGRSYQPSQPSVELKKAGIS
jgi:uncharacterized protein YndB with AHSA1/START domain